MVRPGRLMLLSFTTIVSAQDLLFSIFASELLATPTTTSITSACSKTVCADFTNACGVGYGTCYPACRGYPTPTITPPVCTKRPSIPVTTSPPTATVMDTDRSELRATSGSCDNSICVDYMNTCSLKYGGCFPICSGFTTPAFTDPGCPTGGSVTESFQTKTNSCGYKCDLYVNQCGETYGPGCYTSCPDVPAPSYSTPYCETSVTLTASANLEVFTSL